MKKDGIICVVCGKVVENHLYPLCYDCSPYMYGKLKHPHQKIRRTKAWETNRQIRINKAGHKCEMCRENDDIFIDL